MPPPPVIKCLNFSVTIVHINILWFQKNVRNSDEAVELMCEKGDVDLTDGKKSVLTSIDADVVSEDAAVGENLSHKVGENWASFRWFLCLLRNCWNFLWINIAFFVVFGILIALHGGRGRFSLLQPTVLCGAASFFKAQTFLCLFVAANLSRAACSTACFRCCLLAAMSQKFIEISFAKLVR